MSRQSRTLQFTDIPFGYCSYSGFNKTKDLQITFAYKHDIDYILYDSLWYYATIKHPDKYHIILNCPFSNHSYSKVIFSFNFHVRIFFELNLCYESEMQSTSMSKEFSWFWLERKVIMIRKVLTIFFVKLFWLSIYYLDYYK